MMQKWGLIWSLFWCMVNTWYINRDFFVCLHLEEIKTRIRASHVFSPVPPLEPTLYLPPWVEPVADGGCYWKVWSECWEKEDKGRKKQIKGGVWRSSRGLIINRKTRPVIINRLKRPYNLIIIVHWHKVIKINTHMIRGKEETEHFWTLSFLHIIFMICWRF